jgi:hypothetical protein
LVIDGPDEPEIGIRNEAVSKAGNLPFTPSTICKEWEINKV